MDKEEKRFGNDEKLNEIYKLLNTIKFRNYIFDYDTKYCDYIVEYECAIDDRNDKIAELEQQCKKQKEVIDKIKDWEQNHTILVYTKETPRMLVGTHELLHILYEDKEVTE